MRKVVKHLLRSSLKLFCCRSLEEGLFVRFVGAKAFVLEMTYNASNIQHEIGVLVAYVARASAQNWSLCVPCGWLKVVCPFFVSV